MQPIIRPKRSGYQYFEDPNVGGRLQQMDFCPAYTTVMSYEIGNEVRSLDCTDPFFNGKKGVVRLDESFGEDSRCIDSASVGRPLCLEVECGKYGGDKGKVVLKVGGKRMRCSYAGEILQLPQGTDVICPLFEQTCPESICPANCSGRGQCDFSVTPAQCECFDRTDTSEICSGSPWSFSPTISPAPTISASPSASPTISPMPTEAPEEFSGAGHYITLQYGSILLLLLSLAVMQ